MRIIENAIVWYVGLLTKAVGLIDARAFEIDWEDDDE